MSHQPDIKACLDCVHFNLTAADSDFCDRGSEPAVQQHWASTDEQVARGIVPDAADCPGFEQEDFSAADFNLTA